MSGMDEMTTFLRACVDEDEAAAKAATQGAWWAVNDKHHNDGKVRLVKAEDPQLPGDDPTYATRAEHVAYSVTSEPGDEEQANLRHIARHDPARVLREAAAKRAILALHDIPAHVFRDISDIERASRRCVGCGFNSHEEPMVEDINDCPVRRHLAAIYSDRPGYREEWAP